MRRGEAGTSLVELLMTMVLLSVVLAVLSTGVLSVHRTYRVTTTDVWNREDAMIATRWLSRDLRDALTVTRGATPSTVTLWLDRDDNGVQTAAETVTWTAGTTAAGRPALIRTAGDGSSKVLPSVSGLALSYDPAAPAPVRTVTATVSYPRGDGAQRSDTWSVRNRNTA